MPREILLVRLSALGDCVPVLSVASALKRAFPAARLTWLVQPAAMRLAEQHPAIDECIAFHRRRGLGALRSFGEARRALASRRFDLLLALHTAFKANVVTALARAQVKLGYDRARARELHWLVTTHRIPPRPVQHVQDEYFEFLEHLGVDPRPVEWGLSFTEDERRRQREFFARLERPVCAVVVATSNPRKNWAPNRYARVLDALESDFGFRTILVGGPAPVEQAAARRILELTRARPLNALCDDVRRLAYLLAGSDLVISPDTGPLHIARAFDVPVIGLYGYTNPKRHGPYRAFQDLLVDGYARDPGEDYACSRETRRDGMQRVTVSRVLEKVEVAVRKYIRGAQAYRRNS